MRLNTSVLLTALVYFLVSGSSLSLVEPTLSRNNNAQKSPASANAFERIPVLSYHDDWVCVNKPPGISVHANSRRSNTVTLRSKLKRQLARKVFPVHRLDHRTSGAMLFAFDSQTCGQLHQQLVSGKKDYVAIVRGKWKYGMNVTKTIQKPLKQDGILKEAETAFTCLAVSSDDKMMPACSVLLCQPTTGRTHQIRRHAVHLGHPILGDSQHGDSKVNRLWREKRNLNRLALHCLSIELLNNQDEPGSVLIAPLSPQLQTVLKHDSLMWQTLLRQDPRLVLDSVDEQGGTHGRNYRSRQRES